MKKQITIILISILFVCATGSILKAQESTTLQFMKGMPESQIQNPALHNDSSAVVIGLPGLSGAYFDFSSDFAVNDLIHKGTGMLSDSLVLDMDNFYNKLSETNSIQQDFSTPLFFLGIRRHKSFFSLGLTEKVVSQLTFDKRLIAFLKDGNAPYVGQNYDLGDLIVNAFGYNEIALGYSNEFLKNKLTVGVKAKALMGQVALQTKRMNMTVETAADGSSLTLNSDMDVNFSAPVTMEYDQNGYLSGINGDNIQPSDVIAPKGNFGLAFDLGIVYKPISKLTLSGSIIDLGKISFKNNNYNINHVSHYQWTGIDFSNSMDKAGANYVDPSTLVDNEMNKMKDSFKPKQSEVTSNSFSVTVPTKINLGGTYELTRKIDVGVLDRIYELGGVSQNTITVSANAMIGNFFSLSGSYSKIGNSGNNLGAGFALRVGFIQLYAVSDNLLAVTNPAKTQYINARFGINLLFGRKHPPKIEESTDNQ